MTKCLRRLTDAALLLLFLAALAYTWTGYTLHVWAGWLWLAAVVLHGVLNKPWYQNIFRGAYSPRRVFILTLNMLLWVCTAGLFVSGLYMAYGTLNVAQAALMRQIHVGCAWWLFLLCGVHAGLHGAILSNVFKKIPFPRFAVKYTLWAAGLGFAAWGALGFIRLRLWNKLLFQNSFGSWEGSLTGFIAAAGGLFMLFAAPAHLLMQQGGRK